MAWNPFFNELMYYLANKYRADFNHDAKFRLLDIAQVPTYGLTFSKPAIDLWYNIIETTDNAGKLKLFLETILANDRGLQDEYLLGAISAIDSGKLVADRQLELKEWKGEEPGNLVKEKIMGKRSNLLPIGFLESGAEAAKAIVRIELDNKTGTGFLIEGGWLLTNNHILATRDEAAGAIIQLNYQYPKSTKMSGQNPVRVKAEFEFQLDFADGGTADFYTNVSEDWSLVWLTPDLQNSLTPYGTLKFSEESIRTSDFVNIIQHPLGGPKQIGIYNNMVMFANDDIVQYMTDTNDGSSGSPVLNSDWEVVAIHHSGGWLPDPTTNLSVKRNQGTNIQKIKKFLSELDRKN